MFRMGTCATGGPVDGVLESERKRTATNHNHQPQKGNHVMQFLTRLLIALPFAFATFIPLLGRSAPCRARSTRGLRAPNARRPAPWHCLNCECRRTAVFWCRPTASPSSIWATRWTTSWTAPRNWGCTSECCLPGDAPPVLDNNRVCRIVDPREESQPLKWRRP